MSEPIISKRHFSRLYMAGLTGNKPRTWESVEEVETSDFRDKVALRYCGPGWGGPFITDLRVNQLSSALRRLVKNGWSKSDFYISEQFSPKKTKYLINGEVMRRKEGLCLYYSTENKMMRPALESSGKQIYGISAVLVMRHFLLPADIDDIESLLDDYPDHVLEFSGFDRCVGIYPRHRSVVWELRVRH
jgi:hypothetical protein